MNIDICKTYKTQTFLSEIKYLIDVIEMNDLKTDNITEPSFVGVLSEITFSF